MAKKADKLFDTGCDYAQKNDFVKAIPFFEQAAELGHNGAIASLATIYIEGHGVKPDYKKGMKYLYRNVNDGDVYSINYLGILYLKGKGVPQNNQLAFKYFSDAANNGYPYALLNLADCYELGYGTDVNIDAAVNCYFGIIYGNHNDDITKMAISGLEKHENHPAVQYYLAQKYVLKDRNFEKYKEYIIKSAENGYSKAQYELGKNYEVGISGFDKNLEKSTKWLEKAAAQGDEGAIFSLQYMANQNDHKKVKTQNNRIRYKYKGQIYYRKYLALVITKDFVIQHPEVTLKSLNEIFKITNRWGFDFEFFNSYKEVIVKNKDYYIYFDDPITLGDGQRIAVKMCSDYYIVNNLKKIALQNGFDIEEVY